MLVLTPVHIDAESFILLEHIKRYQWNSKHFKNATVDIHDVFCRSYMLIDFDVCRRQLVVKG